jgi:hypothetical protein
MPMLLLIVPKLSDFMLLGYCVITLLMPFNVIFKHKKAPFQINEMALFLLIYNIKQWLGFR